MSTANDQGSPTAMSVSMMSELPAAKELDTSGACLYHPNYALNEADELGQGT